VVLGHLLYKYRPAMLAPFFVAGYGLLGFGLTLMVGEPALLLTGLAILIGVSFTASIAAVMGLHPAWSEFIVWVMPPEIRPYAFRHIHNSFLLLTAWLLAIWLRLMLDFANFPLPRQGIVLVLMSSLWIIGGRIIQRVPRLVGWYVYSAGWFMWIMGLLQVFFAPTEAIVAVIIGLALSGEALHRSRDVHWMPVFITQLIFASLQMAWIFGLSAPHMVLALSGLLAFIGMLSETRYPQTGRWIAVTGGLIAVSMGLLVRDIPATLILGLLACAGLFIYRYWYWLLPIYVGVLWLGISLGINIPWQFGFVLAIIQWGLGSYLLGERRGFRTLHDIFWREDWSTPFLWGGCLTLVFTFWGSIQQGQPIVNMAGMFFALGIVGIFPTIWWQVPRLPYISVMSFCAAILLKAMQLDGKSNVEVGNYLGLWTVIIASVALFGTAFGLYAVGTCRPFPTLRWLVWWVRPVLKISPILAFAAFMIGIMSLLFEPPPLWFALNTAILAGMMFGRFLKFHRLLNCFVGLVLLWMSWAVLLGMIGATSIYWHTIPLGIVMLLLAKQSDVLNRNGFEVYGILVLLFGSINDLTERGITFSSLVMLAGIVFGLLLYGYIAGRRIPFGVGVTLMLGGSAFQLYRLNPWLLPLMVGGVLIGGVLLLEVRRQWVEGWLLGWTNRLRTWH
jgi:hypothetical protein